MVPGLRQLVAFVLKLAHTQIDPADDRQRETAPVFPILNGRQRLAPKAGGVSEMPLPQLEIGEGAKDMRGLDANDGSVREVKRLVVPRFRLIPAPVLAVAIAKRAIERRNPRSSSGRSRNARSA